MITRSYGLMGTVALVVGLVPLSKDDVRPQKTFICTWEIVCKKPPDGPDCYCTGNNVERTGDSCKRLKRQTYDECEYTDYTDYHCAWVTWECDRKPGT